MLEPAGKCGWEIGLVAISSRGDGRYYFVKQPVHNKTSIFSMIKIELRVRGVAQ